LLYLGAKIKDSNDEVQKTDAAALATAIGEVGGRVDKASEDVAGALKADEDNLKTLQRLENVVSENTENVSKIQASTAAVEAATASDGATIVSLTDRATTLEADSKANTAGREGWEAFEKSRDWNGQWDNFTTGVAAITEKTAALRSEVDEGAADTKSKTDQLNARVGQITEGDVIEFVLNRTWELMFKCLATLFCRHQYVNVQQRLLRGVLRRSHQRASRKRQEHQLLSGRVQTSVGGLGRQRAQSTSQRKIKEEEKSPHRVHGGSIDD